MEGTKTGTLSLQDYIASVDEKTLPRILQVCSGVYFQGSVYEVSGSEVCLSTGDLLKVIRIELHSFTCTDISTNETSELPLGHTGRFQIIPEDTPFSSIEDMVELIPTETGASDTFSFSCHHELELEDCRIPAGAVLSLLAVEHQDGEEEEEEFARCRLVGGEWGEARQEVRLPLSVRGVFYECVSSQTYAAREIVSSPRLFGRHYRHAQASRPGGPLLLRPVYMVQAIMHLRKNVVQFPSSLEVDVVDVSECCGDVAFITPLTLPEVAAQPAGAFPVVAEVLDAPESARPLFHCSWMPSLRPGQLLVLHEAGQSAMVLASSFKGNKERRHFLLSQRYGGNFRQRPRNFGSAYELYAASCRAAPHASPLTVSVAMDWESSADGHASLSVGDQLQVLRRGTMAVQQEEEEVLVCQRTSEVDEGDEEEEEEEGRSEEIHLPMYLQGQFVEKLAETKKRYNLAELRERFPLPLDVKVVRRDPGLEADPLPALSSLQLEEATSEPTVVASLLGQPHVLFELPLRWVTMSVSFTSDPLPWPEGLPPEHRWETVTEVTDQFYFEFRKLTSQDVAAPPPRPPKRRVSTQKAPPTSASCSNLKPPLPKSHFLSKSLDKLNLSSDWPEKRLPLPPPLDTWDEPPPPIPQKPKGRSNSVAQPNAYTHTPKRNRKKERRSSDHDYEDITELVKNAQESVMFY